MLTTIATLVLAATAPDPTMVGRTHIEIISAEWHEDDTITVSGYSYEDRFLFDSESIVARERFYGLLEQAYEDGGLVELIFSPGAATQWENEAVVTYPICVARYGEWVVRSEEGCSFDAITGTTEPIQLIALSRASTMNDLGIDDASRLLPLLEREDLDPSLRLLALMTRSETLESQGYTMKKGIERDQLFLDALIHYRELEEIDPENGWHGINAAGMLVELGDYEAARAGYQAVTEKFPEAKPRNDVSLASIERQLGNYEKALAMIDAIEPGLDEETGEPADRGMRHYYHRGLILEALGRHEEAVEDYTKGLASQPSYSWAHHERACSLANMGELEKALEDARIARQKFSLGLDADTSEAATFNLARLDEIVSILERDVAANRDTPSESVCEGFWSGKDDARERSPLLDTLE